MLMKMTHARYEVTNEKVNMNNKIASVIKSKERDNQYVISKESNKLVTQPR